MKTFTQVIFYIYIKKHICRVKLATLKLQEPIFLFLICSKSRIFRLVPLPSSLLLSVSPFPFPFSCLPCLSLRTTSFLNFFPLLIYHLPFSVSYFATSSPSLPSLSFLWLVCYLFNFYFLSLFSTFFFILTLFFIFLLFIYLFFPSRVFFGKVITLDEPR